MNAQGLPCSYNIQTTDSGTQCSGPCYQMSRVIEIELYFPGSKSVINLLAIFLLVVVTE